MAEQVLEQLFDSPLKVKLLKLFLRHPGKTFAMKEVTKRVKSTADACRYHLDKFRSIKLIDRKFKGTTRLYSVNTEFDFYAELRTLVLKSSPASKKKILNRLKKLGGVKLAILSGVFVSLENSRVDLMVIGDRLQKKKLTAFFRDLEAEVGKELDYVILSSKEFNYRYDMYDRFIRDVLEKPHEKLINKLRFQGVWLSWLERCIHIAKVSGSNPDTPTKLAIFHVFLVFVEKKWIKEWLKMVKMA